MVDSIFTAKDFQEEYHTIFLGTSFQAMIIISENLEVPSTVRHDGGQNEEIRVLPKEHLQSGRLVLFVTSVICNGLSSTTPPSAILPLRPRSNLISSKEFSRFYLTFQ